MVEQVSIPLAMDTVNRLIKQMVQHKIDVRTARVLLYGIGYWHNPTTVNPMWVEVYRELLSYGMEVLVYDEDVDAVEVKQVYGMGVMQTEAALKVRRLPTYDHRLPAMVNCIDVVVYGFLKEDRTLYHCQELVVSRGLIMQIERKKV